MACQRVLRWLQEPPQGRLIGQLPYSCQRASSFAVAGQFRGRHQDTQASPVGGYPEDVFDELYVTIEYVLRTATEWRGLCILVTPPALVNQKEGANPSLGFGPHLVDAEFASQVLGDHQRQPDDRSDCFRRCVYASESD